MKQATSDVIDFIGEWGGKLVALIALAVFLALAVPLWGLLLAAFWMGLWK